MKKRAAAAKGASSVLVSPLPVSSPSQTLRFPSSFSDSPLKPYHFNAGLRPSSSSMKKTKPPPASPLLSHLSSRSPPPKSVASISDLKDLASSGSDSIKRHLDLCHSEILKEIDSSKSRLSKRFKIQSQACLQVTEEAEKEYKKLSDCISGNMEVMKASYAEFITEAQTSASRVCKGSIPELTRSLEKAIEGLRCRYGIPSTTI
ncbi:uncharacterized protein LOC131247909 isoform X1 [Magnolia sinica]|uniref:uncharacterized protein LOC131247909 isoform X1 n=1 Tax=Magnolia sinica TaxID=86752 RepID=UPI00265B7021|nr:uncharacterized protein LOC131247909 isoform X1 [Magnolia sinica]